MGSCQRCKELEDALEHLVVKYWGACGRNQRLASTDPEKREAEMLAVAAKNALDEGRKLYDAHKQSSPPPYRGVSLTENIKLKKGRCTVDPPQARKPS